MVFRAENYADVVELKALFRIFGPYGFKLIERDILKFILTCVNSLKDSLSHNKAALEEFSRNYTNDTVASEAIRKLKDLDTFLVKSIHIGNALHFRQLMKEAALEVIESSTPFIASSIGSAFHSYKRNTFCTPAYMAVDCMAQDCALPNETSDQSLKAFLKKATGGSDSVLWDLLPFMYAAGFTSNIWREAIYKSNLEAHSNGVHTLAKVINEFLIDFKSITSGTLDEQEIVNLQKTFLDVSSVLLLRMANPVHKNEKTAPIDFSSIIVFLDIFVENSPLLERDALEKNCPYAILRNHWKSIYSTNIVKKGDFEYY